MLPEEVFSSDTTLWFSPDGKYLAFASFNDTQVHEMLISMYGTPGSLINQYPEENVFKYPKVNSISEFWKIQGLWHLFHSFTGRHDKSSGHAEYH